MRCLSPTIEMNFLRSLSYLSDDVSLAKISYGDFRSIRAVYNRYAEKGRVRYTSSLDSVGQEAGEKSRKGGRDENIPALETWFAVT